MPGPVVAGDELDDRAIAANEEVGGHAQGVDVPVAGVLVRIEGIREQPKDGVPTELARRQADGMDDH